MAPAMIQARMDPPPISSAANSGAKSQPEPMIDVSDAQVAPISPSSRFRPTSVGLVTVTGVSVAMIDALFSIVPRGACRPPCGADVGVSYEQSEIIVEMIITLEKCCRGFGFITQVKVFLPPLRRNNDTCATSHSDVTVITCEFHSS